MKTESKQAEGQGRSAREAARARLIGDSLTIRSLRRTILKIARVDTPVLITGETGTGKELVAHLLHEQSRRAIGPLVAVNCAALPRSLFQAEVFGYEKGAFTGAFQRHAGRIEAAEGGTLLLDEIGDLARDMQVVLLRFLEEGIFERLGSVQPIQADVRIIAATSTDLELDCRKGRFREDLYHRLNALRIHTPPLRERGHDIELLSQAFLAEFINELGLSKHRFDPDVMDLMRRYRWPGNVRELRNRIRQALVMSEGEWLRAQDLGLEAEKIRPANREMASCPSLRECRDAAERKAIEQALSLAGGKVPAAAELLEISRAQLYRLIERHRINTDLAAAGEDTSQTA